MAFINIYGSLTDQSGVPVVGARIIIAAQRNSSAAFRDMTVSQVTGEGGEYAFSLSPGYYQVLVSYSNDRRNVTVGQMYLEENSESGTLNDYVQFAAPALATPTVYAEIKQWYQQTKSLSDDVGGQVQLATSSAMTAIERSEQSRISASQAKESAESVNSKTEAAAASAAAAESASDRAQNAASMAESLAENNNTFQDVSQGLAGTSSGDFFRVPGGASSLTAFYYYLNDNGTSKQVSETVGAAALMSAIASSEAINQRTGGLRTTGASKHPYEMVDAAGRAVAWLDSSGGWHLPGGVNISSLDLLSLIASEITAAGIAAQSVSVGQGKINPAAGKYLYAETDSAGRVLFGTLLDGSKQYLGYPLKNHSGLMRNDFFFIGDSITAFTQATSGYFNNVNRNEAPAVCSQGWPVWAEMLSNGRIKFAGISATGGYRADQILATHVPAAVAAKPTFCVVLAGRNNVVQNYTLETTIAPMRKIYEALRKAGIIPVCCSMSAQSGNTAAQDALRYALNDWIRSYAEKHSLPFVDMHSATTDPETGEWFSGWNYDQSHPTGAGAKAMARALVATMVDWVGNIIPRMAVSNTSASTSTNLIDNPLFLNSADGINADGWTVVTSGIASLDAATGIQGNAWSLASGSDSTNARRTKTVTVTAGSRLGFGLQFRQNADSASSTKGNYAYIVSGDDAAATTYLAGIRRWLVASDDFGYFWQEFVVPDGVTSVTIILSGENMTVAQLGLFKITEI